VRPIAWYLNLDAEDELCDPDGYAPSAAMRHRVERLGERLAASLLVPGDCTVTSTSVGIGTAFLGQAWCPTPGGLDTLRTAGVSVPPAPPLPVLQRVNHRAFCASLGQPLPDAAFVQDATALHAHVASHPGVIWLFKRPFGFAGRGRIRTAWPVESLAFERWIQKSFEIGDGLQVEPWVERELDAAIHGWVHATAPPQVGVPVLQECSMLGAWIRSRPPRPGELTQAEELNLLRTADVVAQSLHDAGYFGPFGVDAYRWRDAAGRSHFNPRSEINARYTMAWHLGMGGWRPDMQDHE